MEVYLTPYIWGSYSLLVLPPSFPYGGMENPRMTFASPTTIMTNDTSQTYVATHEIAHSWTGNEVTCSNWSNMWLNEGFTVFEERKISAQQHGEAFATIEMLLGSQDLALDITTLGATSSYTSLNPVFNGANPDDAFSEVPYEKGFQFLWYLQSLMNEN
jgi:leukotriene-A4 hydrolase